MKLSFSDLSLKSLKVESIPEVVSVSVLVLWALYILLVRGVVGLLISASIGLVIASFEKRLEIIAAGTVILSFILLQAMKTFRVMEFYTNGGTATEITKRLAHIDNLGGVHVESPDFRNAAPLNTTYSSNTLAVEGFEDMKPDSRPAPAKSASPVGAVPAELQEQVKKALEVAGVKGPIEEQVTDNSKSEKKKDEVKPVIQPFQSEASGLFKLGEIPSESRDGPMIDAGSTFMKAISALDPNQIKSMSEDTAKMVDAQKNLIGLLNTMKPIIQDGSKLLTTFSGILGKEGSGLGGSIGQLNLGQMVK